MLAPAVALLGLCALRPPEIHPESQIGCAALLVLIAAVHLVSPRARLSSPIPFVPLAGLAPVFVLNLLVSCEPHASALTLARWGMLVVLGIGLGVSFGASERHRLASWICGIGCAAALIGLWQGLFGFRRLAAQISADQGPMAQAALARLSSGRISGPFLLPASLAGALALTLPLTIVLVRQVKDPRARIGLSLAGVIQAAALVWTFSLGAVCALVLAAGLVCLPRLFRARRDGLPSTSGGRPVRAAVAFMILAAALIATGVIVRRWVLPQPGPPDRPVAYRMGNWKAAAQMFEDHPVLGTGLGTYGDVYPAYRLEGMNESRYAHCSYLQLLSELGVGGALLVLLALLAAHRIWRAGATSDPLGLAASIGALSFLIHNLVDFTIYQPSVCALFVAALVVVFARRSGELAREEAPVAPSRLAAGSLLGAAGLCAVVLCAAGLSDLQMEAAAAHRGLDPAAEERALERAARLDPLDAEPHGNLASFLAAAPVGSSALERAYREARRAVELDTRTAYRRRDLAWIQLKRGRMAEAWVELSEAVSLHPIKREYREDLAQVEARLFHSYQPASVAPSSPSPSPSPSLPPGSPSPPGSPLSPPESAGSQTSPSSSSASERSEGSTGTTGPSRSAGSPRPAGSQGSSGSPGARP